MNNRAETIFDFEEVAKLNGYHYARKLEDGRCIAIMELAFTTAIIVYRDKHSIDDRWCYHDATGAVLALIDWAGRSYEGEPIGWHRHPYSGRRRPDGDAAKEYIHP